ncbi:MAG: DUF1289 domain-containing protein [Salinisphaeraceae bacterium]|nr:DUF1289 domain-containing protein [Salinisphaeraceae bacterium]
MKSDKSPTVESPCVQVCELNAQDVCVGCGRSLDEIGQWLTASELEKRHILVKATNRLAQTQHSA